MNDQRPDRPNTDNVTPLRNIKHVSFLWASPDRAAEIAVLHSKLFDPPWDEASIAKLLEHPASTSLVAVTGDPKVTIGFVIGQLAADEAEIISVGVTREWQRAGLGRRLIEGLARATKRDTAKRLFLEVAENNSPAAALYKSLGFKEVGRRKAYYKQSSGYIADAIILALDL